MHAYCLNAEAIPKRYQEDAYGRQAITVSPVRYHNLERLGCDSVWYWYMTGMYDGSGMAIIRKHNKYYLHNMSHCSCYGPFERTYFNIAGKPSCEELLSDDSATNEYLAEVMPLVETIVEGFRVGRWA